MLFVIFQNLVHDAQRALIKLLNNFIGFERQRELIASDVESFAFVVCISCMSGLTQYACHVEGEARGLGG